MREQRQSKLRIKKKTGIHEILSLPHYRRENLFLKALIVFAIIGAISVRKMNGKKKTEVFRNGNILVYLTNGQRM